MTLFSYINLHKEKLTSFLNHYFDQKINLSKNEVFLNDSYKKIKQFSVSGKMVRGVLTVFSYEALGGKINKDIYSAASAVELTHSSFLVHDDIIDRDSLRRGNKTIYAQFIDEAKVKRVKDPDFYGNSMGICSGDIAFMEAFQLLTESTDSTSVLKKLIPFYTSVVQSVNGAQMLDFHYGSSREEPTPEQILQLYKNKSARYTFSLPFVLGAILAGAEDENIKVLNEMGEKLGLVFQIKDDEIEMYSNEGEIGKPVGSDIRENKKTLFRAYLFQHTNIQEKKKLLTIYGNQSLKIEDIEFVKFLISKYGVNIEVQNTTNLLSVDAKKLLSKLKLNNEYKLIFEELIEYNLTRTS